MKKSKKEIDKISKELGHNFSILFKNVETPDDLLYSMKIISKMLMDAELKWLRKNEKK